MTPETMDDIERGKYLALNYNPPSVVVTLGMAGWMLREGFLQRDSEGFMHITLDQYVRAGEAWSLRPTTR